jgi:hypothetical protein
MRYRYTRHQVPQPIISLKGRMDRPRPVVSVGIAGPKGHAARDAVVDPAADDTVFPQEIATAIGIDLANAPIGGGKGVGNRRVRLRFAEVTLRLTDGKEFREWRSWVGFAAVSMKYALLGFAGCLQNFTATFYGDREELELTVNNSYPGT